MKSEFFKYIGFNILGMIGISCYILADTFFVANALGASGLAALNLAIPVYSVINATGLMLGIGGATRYMIGKSKAVTEKSGRSFTSTVAAGAICGIIGLLAGIFLTVPLAGLLGASGETLNMTISYLRIILCFSPLFILNNILLAFIRNDGSPQLSMTAMIAGSLFNIVMDYAFLFPGSMGIAGAALATGLAPLVSITVLSIHLLRKKNGFYFSFADIRLRQMLNILPPGLSAFATELSSGIVLIVFNLQFLKYSGDTGVAAYGIVANISLVGIAVFTGIAQGIQPLTSRAYGLGDIGAQKKLAAQSLLFSLICGMVLYLLINLNSDGIIAAFNRDNSASLFSIAEEGVWIYFTGFFFAGINIAASAFLSAVGRETFGFLITMVRGCIAILPLAFLLPELLGMTGIWLSFPLAEFAACMVTLLQLILWSRNDKL